MRPRMCPWSWRYDKTCNLNAAIAPPRDCRSLSWVCPSPSRFHSVRTHSTSQKTCLSFLYHSPMLIAISWGWCLAWTLRLSWRPQLASRCRPCCKSPCTPRSRPWPSRDQTVSSPRCFIPILRCSYWNGDPCKSRVPDQWYWPCWSWWSPKSYRNFSF